MKKLKNIFIIAVLLLSINTGKAQIGLSYFFPENGYLTVPVAPLSYSQAITFGDFRWIKLIPTASFYTIGGMSVRGIPIGYDFSKPLMGPMYSITASIMPAFSIPIGPVDIDLCGGYFGSYNIAPKINTGNLDRMLAQSEGWDVCTSNFTFDNNISHGFVYGVIFTIWFNDNFAIAPGVVYYDGSSPVNLRGDYSGGNIGGVNQTKSIEFSDSRLNYRGFEIQIGIQF